MTYVLSNINNTNHIKMIRAVVREHASSTEGDGDRREGTGARGHKRAVGARRSYSKISNNTTSKRMIDKVTLEGDGATNIDTETLGSITTTGAEGNSTCRNNRRGERAGIDVTVLRGNARGKNESTQGDANSN